MLFITTMLTKTMLVVMMVVVMMMVVMMKQTRKEGEKSMWWCVAVFSVSAVPQIRCTLIHRVIK